MFTVLIVYSLLRLPLTVCSLCVQRNNIKTILTTILNFTFNDKPLTFVNLSMTISTQSCHLSTKREDNNESSTQPWTMPILKCIFWAAKRASVSDVKFISYSGHHTWTHTRLFLLSGWYLDGRQRRTEIPPWEESRGLPHSGDPSEPTPSTHISVHIWTVYTEPGTQKRYSVCSILALTFFI